MPARRQSRDAQEAWALYETTKEICSRLDLEETLQAIVRRARQMLDADVAYLATRVPGRSVLLMRAFDQVRSARFMALELPFGFGLGGQVAERRGPVATYDYVSDPELVHDSEVDEIVLKDEGLRSVLGVPVEFEQELLGVLFAANRRRSRFTARQRTLLSSLGNSAAIAIHNASLYEDVRRAMTIHESLMRVVLAERGLPAVATTLAGLIESPVLLLDAAAQPLASASHDGADIPIPERTAVERAIRGAANLPVRLAAAGQDLLVGTITLGEAVEGYLVVGERPAEDALFRVALEQGSTVFALELAKMRSAEMAALHLRGDLLDQLLADQPGDPAALNRQAVRLGHDLAAAHHVAVVKPRAGLVPGPTGQNRLVQVALDVVRRLAPRALLAWRGDALVVLTPGALEVARQVCRELVRDGRSLAGADLVVGISGASDGVQGLRVGYAEATAAAGAAAALAPAGPVVLFHELGFSRALLGVRPPAELRRLAERVLGDLLDAEAPRRADLLPALRAYLVAGGNLQAAARATGLHVNTLRYRLRRIEGLLGCDLRDPARRMDLQLALEVMAALPDTRSWSGSMADTRP